MNHYERLGIDPGATQDEIDKAFRRESLKHHPDAGGDVEEFKKLQRAHETLGDPERRAKYDQTGDDSESRPVDRVAGIVSSMVTAAFEQDREDCIGFMRKRTDAGRAELQAKRSATQSRINKLSSKMREFESENEGESTAPAVEVIAGALQASLSAMEREVAHYNEEIETADKVLAFLDGVKYPQGSGHPSASQRPNANTLLQSIYEARSRAAGSSGSWG